MSKSVIAIVALVSAIIWIAVSKEAVKPLKDLNRRKMKTLLFAGTLSTLFITISLFKSLSL